MAIRSFVPTRKRANKPKVDITIRDLVRGYVSNTEAIRTPKDALTDMTNLDLKYGGLIESRPGTVQYGAQTANKIIGLGKFIRVTPLGIERYQISMQVEAGAAVVFIRQNGDTWTRVPGNYSFKLDAWAGFTQSNDRVYITNGEDYLAFYDIKTNAIVWYDAIANPAQPTVTANGLSGSTVTYRLRVSANNKVGETAASEARLVTVGAYRNSWEPKTQSLTITTNLVPGADSYNFYIGTVAGEEEYIGTVPKPATGTTVSFTDDNLNQLNPFKKAPEGNSTEGPVLGALIESGGQLFGVMDKNNKYRYWYSAGGDKSGSFDPFSGGGYVDVGLGTDSVPVAIKAFREGQGKPAITILTRGSAGQGKLYHQMFETQSIGDFIITYPLIQPANGQAGTYSPMAVVEENNALHYPTGLDFKTTGTKPEMVNILVTDSMADTISKDLPRLNLSAMDKAVGLAYKKRLFFALPVGADHNNEIWICDLAQRGAWILRWTIPADYMMLYEDSAGNTHFLILTDNKIVELSDSALDDDGVPFKTRFAPGTVTFDDTGLLMAYLHRLRILLLNVKGKVKLTVYGLAEGSNSMAELLSEEYSIKSSSVPTTWDEFLGFDSFTGFDANKVYKEPPAQSQLPIAPEIDTVVSQATFDITTESRSRYSYHSGNFSGKIIPGLYSGDD